MTYQLTVVYGTPPTPPPSTSTTRRSTPRSPRRPGLLSYTAHKAERAAAAPGRALHGRGAHLRRPRGLLAGFGGPEGQAAGEDVPTFATGGATLLTGEVTTYVLTDRVTRPVVTSGRGWYDGRVGRHVVHTLERRRAPRSEGVPGSSAARAALSSGARRW